MFTDKRVLTIDDSTTIRSYLTSFLTPFGAKVEGAGTGQEGLELCAATPYDLILLDLILPDADGIDILQRIREKNMTSTIVMLTGHGGIKSAIAAIQMGADGYLQKQEMTATTRDHAEFLYALEQAFDHRAGLVAKQQLEVMRADFYAMVTHDLRNPAGTVQSALEMLSEEGAPPLEDSQKELLHIARYAVAKMIHLINDYLDYAKIDAGYLRLDPERVELCQLVEESARLSTLQARARHQTLKLDLPQESVWAFADAERLKQVLDNLLSNACKYTPEKGRITVQLRVEEDRAVFRVSDTGIGLKPEQIPSLFAKYQRVSSATTRNIRGTGLGLLIVKEIVGAHGGKICAESEGVGKGTTFVFDIPLDEDGWQATQDSQPTPVLDAEKPLAEPEPPELYQIFVQESTKHVRSLRDLIGQLRQAPANHDLIKSAQRLTHTLKGDAGAMHFLSIRDLAARMDDQLRQANRGEVKLSERRLNELNRLADEIDMLLAL